MRTRVAASNLRYTVGSAILLNDVSITVDAGELVGVIGPNGAGKSTLLHVLAGDLIPAAGTVEIGGANAPGVDEPRLARLRAVLPQHRTATVPFTAYEVVAMGRYPYRRDPTNTAAADEKAIGNAMARTATVEFTDRGFATLSGGEQARVSLARVFAQETPVLLLDEPTAALDVAHEERVMQELTTRAASGSAVVAVLHDLNTAARYATRIVAMAQGEVRAQGSAQAVLTSELLTEIYDQPMRVVPHPFRDCPLVLVAD